MSEVSESKLLRFGRLPASLISAAAITLGLFFVMDRLVDIGEVKLAERTYRSPMIHVLKPEKPLKPRAPDLSAPVPMDVTPPPRTQQVARLEAGDIFFAPPVIAEPVSAVPRTSMEQVIGPVRTIDRRTAVPVRNPVPDYPTRALTRNLEGHCNVTFSVDAAGRPYDLTADCSDEVFRSSSLRAVERALFAAKMSDGVPVGQDNLVYPIYYSLND
mgnify:CR=1 FL=1